MQRTGKPELLHPSVGLYFTNRPPTRAALVIGLLSQLIDIPPGETNYVVERTFKLPVDVQVLAVLPHLHYLGKEVQGFALLPDGTRKWLLFIKQWDFNWQSEYRYVNQSSCRKELFWRCATHTTTRTRIFATRITRRAASSSGQEAAMKWVNSGSFRYCQNNPTELATLQREWRRTDSQETAAFYEDFLRRQPDDAPSHVALGKILGPLGQTANAAQHFQTALRLNPAQPEAHYYLGLILFDQRRFREARTEFENELRLNPKFYKAHLGISMISVEEENLDEAEAQLRAALRINPKDSAVRESLDRIVKAKDGAK